ncbi:MAG: glycosyltransferase family 2 protein [Bacteroidia bacterium]|nr:glycosyltransferase family 2 protein [Bacteroidia bacterium]
MNLSIVVPLYNEAESLPELTAWIRRVLDPTDWSYEVILVDDGSRDGSWEVIRGLQAEMASLRGIRFQRNYGKSAALQVGFAAAQGKVVITMDADLQDSPDEVPALYHMITAEGYDLVSGWKRKRHDPIGKTLPSRLFNAVARAVSGIHNLHDFNCGLKAYKSEVVKNIEVYGEMHRYIPMLAKWAGFDRITEKPVEHHARKYGVSKFGVSRLITGFLDLISLLATQKYLKKPMHFFGTWGVLFAAVGGGTMLYLAFIRLVQGIWITDRMPAMLFGATTLLMGLILFSTGLLGELIARNSPIRNEYRIAETMGLPDAD